MRGAANKVELGVGIGKATKGVDRDGAWPTRSLRANALFNF